MKNLLKISLLVVGLILVGGIGYWYYNNVYYYTETITYYNGEIKEQTKYKDGLKNGLYVSYYENGQIKEEGTYENGEKDGKRIHYYENGQIEEEGIYRNGEKDGKRISWRPEPEYKPARIDNYKNGKPEGERILYYNKGNIRRKGNYKNGKPEGEWIDYYSDGKIEEISNYENGELIGNVKKYSSNGKLEMEIGFDEGNEIWYSPDGEVEHVIVHNNGENSIVGVDNNSDITDEKMRTNEVKLDIDTNNYELSDSDRKILEESKKILDKYNYTTYDKDFRFDEGYRYPFPSNFSNTDEVITYYNSVRKNLANLIGYINVENPSNVVRSNDRMLEVSKKYIQLIDEVIKDTKEGNPERCYLDHMVLKNTILDWYIAKDGGCHNESCQMVTGTEDALINYYSNLQKN